MYQMLSGFDTCHKFQFLKIEGVNENEMDSKNGLVTIPKTPILTVFLEFHFPSARKEAAVVLGRYQKSQ